MPEANTAASHDHALIDRLGLTREAVLEVMSTGFIRIKTQFGIMVWAKNVVEREELLDSGCIDPVYTLNEILNIALVFKATPGAVDQFQAIKKVMGSRTTVVPDEPLFIEDYLDALPSTTPKRMAGTPTDPIPGAIPDQILVAPVARPEAQSEPDPVTPEVPTNYDRRRQAVNCI